MFYSRSYKAASGDCDIRGGVSLPNLMRQFQNLAEDHLFWMGQDMELMFDSRQVFLMGKMEMDIRRQPQKGEEVFFWTAPTGLKGARFLREFVVTARRDEPLVYARSLWLLVDPVKRRPLRPSAFLGEIIYEESRMPEDWSCPACQGGDFEEPAQRQVMGFSKLDINGHVNNACYAEIICDALPFEELASRKLRGFTVEFLHEMKAGDAISLYMRREHDSYRVRGIREDKICFDAALRLG